jgi:hypothetical protein
MPKMQSRKNATQQKCHYESMVTIIAMSAENSYFQCKYYMKERKSINRKYMLKMFR